MFKLLISIVIGANIGYLSVSVTSAQSNTMKQWMRTNLAAPLGQEDMSKLSKGLRYVANKPIIGMDQWSAIATRGADAADKGDMSNVKQSCKDCHNLYKKVYKENHKNENW